MSKSCTQCGREISWIDRLFFTAEYDIPASTVKEWLKCVVCGAGQFTIVLKGAIHTISIKGTVSV